MAIRVIMLGDVVGLPGVRALEQQMPVLRGRWAPDYLIVNGENAADGSGLTPRLFRRILEAGVDGVTLGDHAFRKMQICKILDGDDRLIRPLNMPEQASGRGWMKLQKDDLPPIYVITVLGRIFVTPPADDPFATVERALERLPEANPIVLVEIHAEATSEKRAMGWHFDGRVAAVIGTHTHVPTADAELLARNTAYITDLGMTGPYESIIGRRIDRVLTHMTTAMAAPFDVANGDPRVCGVAIDIDPGARRATNIERIELPADVSAPPFAGVDDEAE